MQRSYGIVEAGRYLEKTGQRCMLSSAELQGVYGQSQLFLTPNKNETIVLLVAEVIDDFLLSSSTDGIPDSITTSRQRFDVAKVGIDERLFLSSSEATQNRTGNITMATHPYIERIQAIDLPRERRKQLTECGTDDGKTYRSLACTVLYIGSYVLPRPIFVTSSIQQQISLLELKHLILANDVVRELVKLTPTLCSLQQQKVRVPEYVRSRTPHSTRVRQNTTDNPE